MAAKLATVEYDFEGLEPPILTVEQAVERSSFFEVPSFLYPQAIGDFDKGMSEADQKIISAEACNITTIFRSIMSVCAKA